MTTNRYLGRAKAVAQVETITIGGTIAALDTFTATINGKSITVAATNTSATTTAGLLATALNADTAPAEFTEITWEAASATVVGTHDTPGTPFTVTVTDSSVSSTISTTTTVAATGPNHWDNALNWSAGTVPVTGDVVYFDNSSVSVFFGLDQSTVALTSLNFAASYLGRIGLPITNANGYPEYRLRYLDIDCVTLRIGYGEGSGSSLINLSTSSASLACEIFATGSALDGIAAVYVKDTNAAADFDVRAGSVGFAMFGGESASIDNLNVGTQATVYLGDGATQAGDLITAGTLKTYGSIGALRVTDGQSEVNGSTPPTSVQIVSPGTLYYNCAGTCAAVTIGGRLTCERDSSLRTFTLTTIKPGGELIDPGLTITHTNSIDLNTVKELRAT